MNKAGLSLKYKQMCAVICVVSPTQITQPQLKQQEFSDTEGSQLCWIDQKIQRKICYISFTTFTEMFTQIHKTMWRIKLHCGVLFIIDALQL